jgi:hypothetical protein
MKHNEDYLNTLLKENDAAQFLEVSVRSLQGWRFKGGGPKFIKISHRAIRYRKKDLIEWIDGKVRISTSDFGEVENGL